MQGRLTQTQIDRLDPETRASAEKRSREVLKRMSPPGKLGLPPLLEARRIEYGIIDDYFKLAAVFQKVLVFKVPDDGGATWGDTVILKTPQQMQDEALMAPQGIIISAGLGALDCLRSHGIGIGDMVTFTRGVVTQVRAGWIEGDQQWATVLYVDDISSSKDLAERLRSGEVTVERNAKGEHFYRWRDEELAPPPNPDYHPNV